MRGCPATSVAAAPMCASAKRSNALRNQTLAEADVKPDPHDASSLPANALSRRRLLQAGAAAGGGLLLSLRLSFASDNAAAGGAGDFEPNAFIRIGSDGRI